jgi:ssDNA-binding Zn-finger/Zn-ribbon topoisomerase 1
MLAYRIAAECPQCRGELVMRKNKRHGSAFLGCIMFPMCDFTEPVQPILGDLLRQKHDLADGMDTAELADVKAELEQAKRELYETKRRLRAADLQISIMSRPPKYHAGGSAQPG